MSHTLYSETYRPQFHFTAAQGWHNDPNGLVYYKGEYHLFFQHNPGGNEWGNMTWGHAVSRDLVHWQQLPHAIYPDRLGTIFSGSAVVDWENTAGFRTGDEETLVVIYTAAGGTSPESEGQPFTQCIAYSNDRGRTWTKYEGNPVLPHVVGENRDPKVVWHAASARWIMALYKAGNDFAFFASPDLKWWTHLHDITVPGCDECPDFFEMPVAGEPDESRWVWTAANGRYLIGDFDGQHFTPETGPHVADGGANFYAVQTYSDIPQDDGRRIQIAWMAGGKYPDMPFNQQMSFPCELRLARTSDGLRLRRYPVAEIELLRARSHEIADAALADGQEVEAGAGELLDVEAEIEVGDAAEVGLRLRGETVAYRVAEQTLTCVGRAAPLPAHDGRIRLRALVDRTSIEVFGDEGAASLTSCFLADPSQLAVTAFATGGKARLVRLAVRELRSAMVA
jgi:sucrose-6-phosphate hydrolase SacC (GH32 family)